MEDNNRKTPSPTPTRRGSIDGIQTRRPSAERQASGEPNSSERSNQQQASDQKAQSKQQPDKQTAKKPKKSKNLFVVALAAIVFIGLSAFAIYAGLQQRSDNQTANQTEPAAANEEQETVNSGELIDQTINEIDQLNNQPDTSGEGLSNEQLGL